MDFLPDHLPSRELQRQHLMVQCEAAVAEAPTAVSTPARRPVAYKPSMWDDAFIQCLSSDSTAGYHTGRIDKLKQELRGLFRDGTMGFAKQLELVDHVQHLGVGRYFEEEIDDILLGASTAADDLSEVMKDDLSTTALLFRLLRQHGYRVSQDVFNRFRVAKGDFEECLRNDIRGALCLFAASQHAYKGESTLDAARAASAQRLKNGADDVDLDLKEEIKYAIELPLHRRIARLQTRWFIDMYARKSDMNPALLELAVLDFNMVQSVHRKDLKKMSSWWRDLEKLSFARDRIMENFFCTIGIIPEQEFSQCREKLTQVCCLIAIMDDVYDEFGTYDELQLFTNAVERWNIHATKQLPQYMKPFYLQLLHIVGEMSFESQMGKDFDVLSYLKKVWVDLCRSFLLEAKWYHDKHIPTFEEYMCNAWMTASAHVVLAHAFLFMNLKITNKNIDLLQRYPPIIRFTAMIFRLCNDLVEKEGGDTPSSLVCFMNENNVTEEVARRHIIDLIDETWSMMNEEMQASSLPTTFVTTVMNLARTGHYLYQHGDGHSNPGKEFKKRVRSLLLEPIMLK